MEAWRGRPGVAECGLESGSGSVDGSPWSGGVRARERECVLESRSAGKLLVIVELSSALRRESDVKRGVRDETETRGRDAVV